MAWIYLMIASLGEIFGVMFINLYVREKRKLWLISLIIVFSIGFLFLSMAMNDIPLGTAYAIWTGFGAAGAVLIGMIFFKDSRNWKRMMFLSFIIVGAVGLKLLGS